MSAAIHYRITPKQPHAHLYEVVLTIQSPDPLGQHLNLPAWIPGSYMIRDFARNIVTLKASCADGPLTLEKLDKQRWRLPPCDGPVVVTAQVYAWDLSVRGAHLDASHAYFNAVALCLAVEGQTDQPCGVTLVPPPGAQGWRVATTLPSAGAEPYAFGEYQARDYDELLDHPVEMGRFALYHFEACGVPHDVAISGRFRVDGERLCRDLQATCEYQIRLFGEPAPMSRYLFMLQVTGDGYGGLEHRSSTSLMCNRTHLPLPGEVKQSEGYRTLLGLCSHEYFHTWNVKRIKPALFVPYELSREQPTPLLWFFEGVTSYYDDLALLRSGVVTLPAYLELLGQGLTRVLRTPGRHLQSVSDSSFDAWTKLYKMDENGPNAIISYYSKGALIALALDLTLREHSAGGMNLDQVMQALWADYLADPSGVTPQGLEARIATLAGLELSDWFERALRSTDELPLGELLAGHGVHLHLRASEGAKDLGGVAAKQPAGRSALGVRTKEEPFGVRLTSVLSHSPAQRAGLSGGDLLVAVDGLQVSHAQLAERIAGYPIGESLKLHAFRRDELLEFEVELSAAELDTCYLELDEQADAVTVLRRRAWLGE